MSYARIGSCAVVYRGLQAAVQRQCLSTLPRSARPRATQFLQRCQGQRSFTVQHARRFKGEDPGPSSDEHALISTFDLFSIGIGPSSSHTVGPMRAGNIFVADLIEKGLLSDVARIRISIYGSLALTGEGHMTPSALLLGLEGANVETVDTSYIPTRFTEIKDTRKLRLGSPSTSQEIEFDYSRDFIWERARRLPTHSNGMKFIVFDRFGDPIAINDLFSIGGGFVVNNGMEVRPTEESGQDDESSGQVGVSDEAKLAHNAFHKESGRLEDGAAFPPASNFDLGTSSDVQSLAEPSSGENELQKKDSEESKNQTGKIPYPFHNASSLLAICKRHNLTIAQVMYENERGLGYGDDEIFNKLFKLWAAMDNCIREGVQAPLNSTLPGSLKLSRRAPLLYQRLTKGLYPGYLGVGNFETPRIQNQTSAQASLPPFTQPGSLDSGSNDTAAWRLSTARRPLNRTPRLQGNPEHAISLVPVRSANHPAMDYLTAYAIAVNENNAAGGRVVTAPTNGAAGIIPAVLKYLVEFVSDDPERDIPVFLLTAAAIASLYKRGATISAAEGGCMAEVGVACSMAAGAYAACMGAGPETIEQAAEIGIEHNLGLTCDPIDGLVQAPCIERNALGAIKAISSANLALNSLTGTQKVRLDDAIRAMRLTAQGMRNEFKETSLSGLATSVPLNIPVSVPDC